MKLLISTSDPKPMYVQIKDGIKQAILDGELKNNELLPSIRQLAKELNVSTMTIKRAYIDLEYEGVIYTIAGKGTFVKADWIPET